MITDLKTPGVYIEETEAFPKSVTGVEAVVPAFIGFTQKIPEGYNPEHPEAYRVESLAEYVARFGKATEECELTFGAHQSVTSVERSNTEQAQTTYYAMQLFFANGGGRCYVVSIGAEAKRNKTELFTGALDALKDDTLGVTLLAFPDAACFLDDPSKVYQAALAQCGKLKNRFVLLDVPYEKKDLFREYLGTQYLEYGAAYTPFLDTTLNLLQEGENGETSMRIAGTARFSNRGVTSISPEQTGLEISRGQLVEEETPKVELSVGKSFKAKSSPATLIASGCLPSDIQAGDPITQGEDPSQWAFVDCPGTANTDLREFELSAVDELVLTGDHDMAGALEPTKAFSALTQVVVKAAAIAVGDGAPFPATLTNEGATLEVEANTKWNGAPRELKIEEKGERPRLCLKTPLDETQISLMAKENKFYSAQVNDTVRVVFQPTSTGQQAAKPKLVFQVVSLETGIEGNCATLSVTLPNDGALNTDVTKAWDEKDEGAKNGFVLKTAEGEPTPITVPGGTPTLLKKDGIVTLWDLKSTRRDLYNPLKAALAGKRVKHLPPSGAIAGIYAAMAAERGVWQAPANVSLSEVLGPSETITDAVQEDLNKPQSGKAINAIRLFPGRGPLVWGARTLDGTSNDWRYIGVRRLFIYVESSLKAALRAYVFEPNTAMTWLKVQAMCESFLEILWRQGALTGGAPNEAYRVDVGPGSDGGGTMVVSVALAPVRPAEFIVLNITQTMQ